MLIKKGGLLRMNLIRDTRFFFESMEHGNFYWFALSGSSRPMQHNTDFEHSSLEHHSKYLEYALFI